MPTIACRRGICSCGDGTIPDFPIENLSAEAPDERTFISTIFPGGDEPKWGETWHATACGGLYWVESTASQEEANMLAAQLDLTCPDDPPSDGDPPTPEDPADPDDPGGGGGGGGGGGSALFYSAAQICHVPCPGGDLYTHQLPYGAIVSDVSQATADFIAANLCQQQAFNLRMCLSPSALDACCVDGYFEATFSVIGGTAPITFTIDPVEIPGGMTLFNGVLSGYPTTSGTYPITVFATDSSVPPRVITKTYSLSVAEITTPADMPAGNIGLAYSETLSSSGAPVNNYWAIVAGALPDGIVIDTATGVISGTPTVGGSFNFTVQLLIP